MEEATGYPVQRQEATGSMLEHGAHHHPMNPRGKSTPSQEILIVPLALLKTLFKPYSLRFLVPQWAM